MRRMVTVQRLSNAITDLAPWRDRRRIGFMHIPRTSGTSLVEAIGGRMRIGRSAYAFDRTLFGDFHEFDQFERPLRTLIHLDASALPRRADFLAGHMACSTLRAAGRDTLMTVLREPRSRLLSHWMFWRNHSHGELASLGAWGDRVGLAGLPLASFLCRPEIACQTDNIAVRMLLSPHPLIPRDDFIDPAADAVLLEAALSVLDRFAFADLLENPVLHRNLVAWLARPIGYERRNESRPMVPGRATSLSREMTTTAVRLLADRCRLDRVLWTHVAIQRLGRNGAAALRDHAERDGLRRAASLLDTAAPARPARQAA